MGRQHTHPGEVLAEEFMKLLGLSARALGAAIGVPGNRVSDIIRQRRDVSADTAIRLARYFGTDPRFWLNLQAGHDLSKAARLFWARATACYAARKAATDSVHFTTILGATSR
jgi:addiction module HigA family antidote